MALFDVVLADTLTLADSLFTTAFTFGVELSDSLDIVDSLVLEGGLAAGSSAPIVPPDSVTSSLGDAEFSVVALSQGFANLITWNVPTPANSPNWGRRLRILRKTGEWPQTFDDLGASVLVDATYSDSVSDDFSLEDANLEAGVIYYYARFELLVTGVWVLDAERGRQSAYPFDRWGSCEYIYDSLPRGFRSDDAEVLHLFQFICVVGAIFDNTKTDVEQLLTLFEIDAIHDDLIKVLDGQIDWPTWDATGALQRRAETALAVDLYKLKGRADSYIQLLGEISGWQVEVFEGWRVTFFVNGVFGSTTPDFTDPNLLSDLGTPQDKLKYINDTVGWQGLSGLLFQMTEIPGVSGPFTSIMVDRANFLLSFFKVSYATCKLVMTPVTEEQFLMSSVVDSFEEEQFKSENVLVPLDEESASTDELSLFLTNDNPGSLTNTITHRLFHSALPYV